MKKPHRIQTGNLNINTLPDKMSAEEFRMRFSNNAGTAQTSKERYEALGRMKAGKMNKTETHYTEWLERKKQAGEVLEYWFEPMNLRLGDNCFYKIDFLVLMATSKLEVHEVKGYWTDDALVKIKVAADKFPFTFKAYRLIKGQWEERLF
jgi:hypothetical protein